MQNMKYRPTTVSINETALLLAVSQSTLRNWELIYCLPIERNHAGQRIYNDNAISLLRIIKAGTTKGLQQHDIKEQIQQELQSYKEPIPIEVIGDTMPEQEQNYNLVIKPYENRITTLEMTTSALTVENKELNRTLGRYEGELSKYNEIITLKDSIINDKDISINELKVRLQEAENKMNKRWYNFIFKR